MAPRIFDESDFASSTQGKPRQFSEADFTPEAPSFIDLKDPNNSPLYAKLASGFMGGLSSLGDLADIGIQGAQSAGRLLSFGNLGRSLGDLNRDNINNIPTNIGNTARKAIDAATNLPNSTEIDPDSWAYRIGSYAPGILAGPGNLAQKAGMDVLMSGAGTVGNEIAGPYGELAAGLLASQLPKAGLNYISGKLDDAALSKYQSLFGYNPENKTRLAGFMDDQGNLSKTADLGMSPVSKKDIKLNELINNGFVDELGSLDRPKDVVIKLNKFKAKAGQSLNSAIDNAAELEDARFANMAPWQKQEYLQKVAPDLSEAKDYAAQIALTDESVAKKLLDHIDSIEQNWQNSDQTIKDLRKFKQSQGITGAKSYNPTKTTEDTLKDTINNMVYSSLADSLEGRISALDPKLGESLKKANKAYSTAITFEEPTFNASRQSLEALNFNPLKGRNALEFAAAGVGHSNPLILGAVGTERLARLLSEMYPVGAARTAQGASDIASSLLPKGSANSNIQALITALQTNDQ